MNFIRKGKYYSESAEGYRISMSGPPGALRFTAWSDKKTMIDVFDKSSDAYQACCEHHGKINDTNPS